MIFSLGSERSDLSLPEIPHTDIICFFHVSRSVVSPPDLWFEILASCLRAKKNVLILESSINDLPPLNPTARWTVGDNWCWLVPRSLSVISALYSNTGKNFKSFKTSLKNSK